ncbi:hypothetical protein [Dyadobacter psychrotolerans]|uniref:Uncharacterized protein n=1 Tax=Dyadobacter psychrotolerans TaxID=2541721 RepID=A0A4R5DNM4_9BACT|nr:hypothetical protein [Dyadobacter psychrotolerans]TDE13710.1 hypothetical protein E0F88_17575 [Dyadobacter psychrotolerans]
MSVLLQMMLISCKEKQNPAEDYLAIWKCQQENNYDEAATRKSIIGTWGWKYSAGSHVSSTPSKNTESSKNLRIKFNEDGSGTIMAKDTNGTFTWTIELKDNNLYGFQTMPFISQVSGRLLFCDNLMMCNGSYVDGPDNIFKKE